MMNLEHRTTIAVLAAGALLIAAIALYVITVIEVTGMEHAFETQRREVTTMRDHRHGLTALAYTLDRTASDRDELRTYIVTPERTIELLGLLETLGTADGAAVSTERIDETEEGKLYLDLKAVGSKYAVMRVLDLLEVLPYKSHVEHAIIRHAPGAGGWEGSFRLVVIQEV